MATPDLPTYEPQMPGVQQPDSGELIASKISEFGNLVQNFTNKTVGYAKEQLGLKEKATEMVLKTNIDTSMRAFARSSINQFDPKSGIASFEKQADDYTNKLLEGVSGIHADVIRAYAQNAKSLNLQPLHTGAVKQAFNEARVNLLNSVSNFGKDISQSIGTVPLDEALSHHNASAPRLAPGQLEAGNIDLTNRPHVKNKDGSVSTVRSIGVESDGKHYVIPTVAETGVILSDEEAIELWKATGDHLGVFKTRKDADNFAQNLHESEEKKLMQGEAPEITPTQERNAPSIDSIHYKLSQALNNIDGGIATGLISATYGQKLKEKITGQAEDEMLYHKYQLAVQEGQGDKFIQAYAKANQGRMNTQSYAKHMAEFSKIEHRELAERGLNEKTAQAFVNDNLKRIEMGGEDNPYADTLAEHAPSLFPVYKREKEIRQLSGSLYKQLTSGGQPQAAELIRHFHDLNQKSNISDEDRQKNNQALELAVKNSRTFFKEYEDDPVKIILDKNLMGDLAQAEKIQKKSGVILSPGYGQPQANTIEGLVHYQVLHGTPLNKAKVFTKAQAIDFSGRLMNAAPADKVAMILSLQKEYGKYAGNAMAQLVAQGGLPRSYGFFTHLNPTDGNLPDTVAALTMPEIDVKSEKGAAIKTRVAAAMSLANERAHPDVSTTRRVVGVAYQSMRTAITQREWDAQPGNTGFMGTPALFPESTSADIKLKALAESYQSIAGYSTEPLMNTIQTSVEKLTNYYVERRGMTVDEGLSQAVRTLSNQYEMVDYEDNIVRLPKHKINYNDVSVLFANTPEFISKTNWQLPQTADTGLAASRSDQLAYYQQNIENGHWATDPTDSGLMWVNANGMVNKTANGNPLFISFESIQNMKRMDSQPALLGSAEAMDYARETYKLFKENNVAFNEPEGEFQVELGDEFSQIPKQFSFFERSAGVGVQKAKDFYNYIFEDMQAKQRKMAQKRINLTKVSLDPGDL